LADILSFEDKPYINNDKLSGYQLLNDELQYVRANINCTDH